MIARLVSGMALPTQNTTGWDVFNTFVPDPNTSCSYTAPTLDTGYNDALRVYCTEAATPGYGQAAFSDGALGFAIDTWLTGGSDPNTYTVWNVGTITMRYLNARLTLTVTPGQVPYITDFTPIVDTAPTVEQGSSLVVSAGGTAITFNPQFHFIPQVLATVVGSGSALTVTVNSLTATGCTFHVFNSSGTDVGGTINWQATGE